MLPGFNHNIKYKNIIFHIQTEDSGEENSFIISHLFIGGNIIATKKISYAHLLGSENLNSTVRSLMENQHKDLIKELLTGKFDTHPVISGTPSNSQKAESEKSHIIETQKKETIPIPDTTSPGSREQSHFKPVNSDSNFTVFGEGTITEESLDRIILRFLREKK